jgi:RecG-like helicase
MVGFGPVAGWIVDRNLSTPPEGRMKLDSIIKRFLPREERFQELLLKDTQNLTRSAELFLAIARSTKLEDRRIKLVELKALEHEGDEITRQVFEALNFRADSGTQRHGHDEVEGDLPEPRGCLRLLQGLHPHHRQRGDQERLSRPTSPK